MVHDKKSKRGNESIDGENVCLVKEGYLDDWVQEKESPKSSDDDLEEPEWSRVCASCGMIPCSLTKYSEEV